MNARTKERTDARTNKCTNKRTNDRMTNERMNERMNGWMNLALRCYCSVWDWFYVAVIWWCHFFVWFHSNFAFFDNRKMNVSNVAHLVYDWFEICILSFQLNIFLNNVWKFWFILSLKFVKVCRLDASREFLMLKLFEQDIRLLVISSIFWSLFSDIHLIIVKLSLQVLQYQLFPIILMFKTFEFWF